MSYDVGEVTESFSYVTGFSLTSPGEPPMISVPGYRFKKSGNLIAIANMKVCCLASSSHLNYVLCIVNSNRKTVLVRNELYYRVIYIELTHFFL